MTEDSEPQACGQVTIDAAPDEVYRLVSDPLAMVEFAEELYRVRWLNGTAATGVGARFRGDNRNGWHHWWTIARVTDAEKDRRFAFEVRTPFWVPIARWQYDIEPVDGGSRVTESAWIRAPAWFGPIATLITGEADRVAADNAHIATTLRRLKQHLESSRVV